MNPALEMFADVIRKATENDQNCRKFLFFFIYGFYNSKLFLHALPFWFLYSLSSGGGACNGVVWSVHCGLEGCGVVG